MPRFVNENTYDAIITKVVAPFAASGVTVPLVKAMIATESAFKPRAYREEAHLDPPDASRGLMQILLRTAKGVGFVGEPERLYDPETNIFYGVKFLAGLIRARNNDVLAAVSAYNNGNGRRAKTATSVCLARDKDGNCIRRFMAKPGQFFNQPYVDKVLEYLRYFGGELPTAQAGGGAVALVLLLAFALSRGIVRV